MASDLTNLDRTLEGLLDEMHIANARVIFKHQELMRQQVLSITGIIRLGICNSLQILSEDGCVSIVRDQSSH
jgi:phosphoribosylformylglycinamidine (FGAM) synthase-like amidotransferase family enzyme